MPKYEVPLHYTVWIEVEAENSTEAWHKAGEPGSETDFSISAEYLHQEGGPCVSFLETGHPSLINELEDQDA